MKVRVLEGKSFVSYRGCKTPGVVFDAPNADAKHLVDGGWCEYVETPKPVEEVKEMGIEELLAEPIIEKKPVEEKEVEEVEKTAPKKRGRKKKGE